MPCSSLAPPSRFPHSSPPTGRLPPSLEKIPTPRFLMLTAALATVTALAAFADTQQVTLRGLYRLNRIGVG